MLAAVMVQQRQLVLIDALKGCRCHCQFICRREGAQRLDAAGQQLPACQLFQVIAAQKLLRTSVIATLGGCKLILTGRIVPVVLTAM